MFRLEQAPRKPLPVIQRRIRDELLSSWLTRCARFYRANALQLINHMGIACEPHPAYRTWSDQVERALDFRPAAPIVRRIAWCLHVREPTIAAHASRRLERRGLGKLRQDRRDATALPSLPSCFLLDRLSGKVEVMVRAMAYPVRSMPATLQYRKSNTLRSAGLSALWSQKIAPRLWRDAVRGSAIVDRWLRREPCGLIPPPWIMRLLKQPLACNRAARNSRLLSVLVPEAATGIFRPAQTRVDLCGSSLPDRVSILAGIARFNDEPAQVLSQFTVKTTPAGRGNINDILNALPNVIADELRATRLSHGRRQHGALTVLAHSTSLKLAANLRKIEESRLKIKAYSALDTLESHI